MNMRKRKKKLSVMKCPYCFSKFSHDEVCFKAMSAFSRGDFEAMGNEDIERKYGAQGAEEIAITKYVIEKFIKQEDVKYREFWEKCPKCKPYWEYEDYPVIAPNSSAMMNEGDGYCVNVNGIIRMAVDYFGKESFVRICPQCHNELPGNYGENPVFFILMIERSDAEKSLFYSKLLEQFAGIIGNMGMAASVLENRCGTQLLHNPVVFDVFDRGRGFSVVFYEICIEKSMGTDITQEYKKIIESADGFIMPLEASGFMMEENADDPEWNAMTRFVERLGNALVGSGYKKMRSTKPFAVVSMKTDAIKQYGQSALLKSGKKRRLLEKIDTYFDQHMFFPLISLDYDQVADITKYRIRQRKNEFSGESWLGDPLLWILTRNNVFL